MNIYICYRQAFYPGYSGRNKKKIIIKRARMRRRGSSLGRAKRILHIILYNAFIHTHYAVHYYSILYYSIQGPKNNRGMSRPLPNSRTANNSWKNSIGLSRPLLYSRTANNNWKTTEVKYVKTFTEYQDSKQQVGKTTEVEYVKIFTE